MSDDTMNANTGDKAVPTPPPSLAGRPRGGTAAPLLAARRFAEKIVARALTAPGIPLLVEMPEGAETAMAQTALLLHARLIWEYGNSRLLQPDRYDASDGDSAMLIASETPTVIMNAPLLPQLEPLLMGVTLNSPCLLLGTQGDWERADAARTWDRWRPGYADQFDETVTPEQIDTRLRQSGQSAAALWGWTARQYAFGIPLPISLAARLMEIDETEVHAAAQIVPELLAFLERDPMQQPVPMLCTIGQEMASRWLTSHEEERDTVAVLGRVFVATDMDNPVEAHAAWALGLALLRHGRRRLIRGALIAAEASLPGLWTAGGGASALAWGRILAGIGQYDTAIQALAAGIQRDPDNPILLHAAAQVHLKSAQDNPADREDRFQTASDLLDRIQDREPLNPYALHTRAEMERLRGNGAAARQLLTPLFEMKAGRVPALTAATAAMIDAGDRLVARALLRRLSAVAPDSPYTHHLAGRLARLRRDYTEMTRRYHQALTQDPDNLPTLTEWATAARDRGQFALADRLLGRAVEIDPESLYVRHAMAELNMERGNLDQAQEAFLAILAEYPQHVQTLVSLGRLLASQAAWDDAFARLAQARQRSPDSPVVFAAWLDTLIDRGNLAEAERQTPPDLRGAAYARLQMARARLAAARGDIARAGVLYEQAVQDDVAYAPERVLNAWGQAERAVGRLADAERLHRRALEYDPDNAYTRLALAETLAAQGHNEDSELERAEARRLQNSEEEL